MNVILIEKMYYCFSFLKYPTFEVVHYGSYCNSFNLMVNGYVTHCAIQTVAKVTSVNIQA